MPTRRSFLATAAATLTPRYIFAQGPSAQRITIRPDVEIGTIRPEFHGHFAEHLGSCVYGGLWVGKDSRIPNVSGYRKAAIDSLKELGVPVLRWPGGCFADDYHWRDGIGPSRPKRVNIHWGNYVEDNSFGTHEFITLCRLLNAEPYFAGNLGSGTPSELRQWIEYCNFPSGSTLSDERARNGSPAPFNVRYWGIGNENWGCGGNMTPDFYADTYRQFASYVRAFGDTKPFMIACGPNSNNLVWTRHFFDTLANRMTPHGYAMHFYENSQRYPTDFNAEVMAEQFAKFDAMERAIVQQRALLDSYDPQRRIGLLVDEWGVWDRMNAEEEKRNGKLYQQSTIRSAVGAALGLNAFNRQADKLYMCNIAQIVNVLQSLLLTDGPEGTRCVRTTSYYAFQLFKAHRGNKSVQIENPTVASVSASRGSGSEVVLTLVNPTPATEMDLECQIPGRSPRNVSAEILHNRDMNAANTFDQPDLITPQRHAARVDGQSVRVSLPPLSILTMRIS